MSVIEVNKLTPLTNNGTVTMGDSGDTISIPSGVTIANAGTATGFGGTNTPSFSARITRIKILRFFVRFKVSLCAVCVYLRIISQKKHPLNVAKKTF